MGIDKNSGSLKQLSSSVYLLKALIAFSSERGADTEAIIHSINFDVRLLDSEQARVPIAVLNQLWGKVSEALNDPCLGLHFGEAFGAQCEGHFLFTIMKNCETLSTALQSLIRYHGLMTDIVKPTLSLIDGKVHIVLDYQFNRAMITRHFSDAVLSLLATVLRRITNDGIVFESLSVTHPGTGTIDEYARIFGIGPVFDSGRDSIVFDESELNRAFPLAHHEFASYLRHYADVLDYRLNESMRYSDKVTFLLKKCILKGEDCSLNAIAKNFDMSARHLQNKLKDETVSFKILADNVKKEIAIHYLQQKDILFCDIAFLLGFSEQSSFNHSFKKWTGKTPREFRDKK